MNDLISSTEIIRWLIASLGIAVTWKGRGAALAGLSVLAQPEGHDEDAWDLYYDNEDRLGLAWWQQTLLFWAHVLFWANATTNFWYGSSPIEQPNVATSNVMQIVVPVLLIALSWLITNRLKYVQTHQDRWSRRHDQSLRGAA